MSNSSKNSSAPQADELSVFLLVNEERHATTPEGFKGFLLEQESYGAFEAHFLDVTSYVGEEMTGTYTENIPIIMSWHAEERAKGRLLMDKELFLEVVRWHLGFPVVATRVLNNGIRLSDDGKSVVTDDGKEATVVACRYLGTPILVIYEASASYIRVKTAWDLSQDSFRPFNADVIILRDDGSVSGFAKNRRIYASDVQ